MCGIAGFMGLGDEQVLKNMISSIKHRGPDVQVHSFDSKIALAHARLSIIDLRPEGNQPMFSNDRSIVITFNGEIYNYLELKKQLELKYTFKTTTDTEVLLNLYSEHGVKMLEKINGMFAFAIYDYKNQTLFLAKDRMGKKPLYYSVCDNSFVFASELKAILEHPGIERTINLEAVNQYLTFDYIPTPNSIINNVYKLEPAHYLIVKDNHILEKTCYWQHNFDTNNITFEKAKEKFDFLLNEAVKKRLMSDVPLGVFLSGGLDSSTIAYYAQKNSKQKIKTFSIGFEDKSYDEGNYARSVADHLGTDHYSKVLTSSHTLELLDKILPLIDEPFADASLIPTYFLSEFTHNHVTVALGGDGSDELMAGYPTFISDKFKSPFSKFPPATSDKLYKFANALVSVSDKNISLDFKIKQFFRGFASKPNHIHQLWLGSFIPDEKKRLFKPEVYETFRDKEGLEIIDFHFEHANTKWSDFDKTIYYYYQTYLLDDILVKVDRASMFNSLEVRAPFLDKDLVEFLNSLPRNFKQRGFQGKYILKKLMTDKLPQNIIWRPKKGFGIPLSSWIRNNLKLKIEDVLLKDDPYFNQKYIRTILSEHYSKKANHRKLIWNLYILKKYFELNGFN